MTEELLFRKQVYRKLTELVKQGIVLYDIFEDIDIPKTTNMNGITLNLSALSQADIYEISKKLQNITFSKKMTAHTENTIHPEPAQVYVKPTPTYKRMRLTKTQKTILSAI